MIWDLPPPTHTCYLESLSPVPHLEAVLAGRHIGFISSLHCSEKPLLKLLFTSCSSDLHTVIGSNIQHLLHKYNKLTLSALIAAKNTIKKSRVHPLPSDQSWKTNLIEEICLTKKNQLQINFDTDDLDKILDHICTTLLLS